MGSFLSLLGSAVQVSSPTAATSVYSPEASVKPAAEPATVVALIILRKVLHEKAYLKLVDATMILSAVYTRGQFAKIMQRYVLVAPNYYFVFAWVRPCSLLWPSFLVKGRSAGCPFIEETVFQRRGDEAGRVGKPRVAQGEAESKSPTRLRT